MSHAQMLLCMVMIFHGKKEDTAGIYSQQSDHGFLHHISLQWNRRVAKRGGRGEGGLPTCPTKIISICPKLKRMSFLMLCFKLEA